MSLRTAIVLGLIFTLLLAGTASALSKLECEVRPMDNTRPDQGCAEGGGVILMRLSDDENAHLELPSLSGYEHILCCFDKNDNIQLNNTPGSGLVIERIAGLTGDTNAHIQGPEYTNYPVSLYLGGSANDLVGVNCGMFTDFSTSQCGGDTRYECLVEMSGETNAHASYCGSGLFDNALCCMLVVDNQPPTIVVNTPQDQWFSQNPTLDIDFNDDKGIGRAEYLVDSPAGSGDWPGGEPIWPGDCPEQNYNISWNIKLGDWISLDEGPHNLSFWAVDDAGNERVQYYAFTFNKDVTKPETTDGNDGEWHRPPYNIELDCNDPGYPAFGSGCNNTYWCIDYQTGCFPTRLYNPDTGIQAAYGGYLRYYSKDLAGNEEVVKTSQYQAKVCGISRLVLDPAAPIGLNCETESGLGDDCETGERVLVTANFTRSCNLDGPVSIKVEGGTYSCRLGDTGDMPAIEVDCSSATCGTTNCICEVPWTIPSIPETCKGEVIYPQTATVGNSGGEILSFSNNLEGSFKFFKDIESPQINLVVPQYSNTRSVTAQLSVTDNTGIQSCSIDWGSGPQTLCTNCGTVWTADPNPSYGYATDGLKRVNVTCTDINGNTGSTSMTAFVDTQAPLLDADDVMTPDSTPDVVFSLTDPEPSSGLRQCTLIGGENATGLVPVEWTCAIGTPLSVCTLDSGYVLKNGPHTASLLCTDNAMNPVSDTITIIVDTDPPTCIFDDPKPPKVDSPFVVNWRADDGPLGSGAEDFTVVYTKGNNWFPITDICSSCGTFGCSECVSPEGTTLTFRCNATDRAGNAGPYTEVTASINTVKTSVIAPLPEWMGPAREEWDVTVASGAFWVSWGTADPSNITCFNVRWSDNGGGTWTNFVNSTGGTCIKPTTSSMPFVNPTTDWDGKTYHFQVRVVSQATPEPWPELGDESRTTSTTIDSRKPELFLTALDSFGNPIEGYAPENLGQVRLSAASIDNTSGLKAFAIFWETNNGETQVMDCPLAGPGEESECRTELIPFAPGSQIRYWSTARDLADNSITKPDKGWGYIVSNPIASFESRDIELLIGRTLEVLVLVRNLEPVVDDIELTLETGKLSAFFSRPEEGRISADGRVILVKGINPGESRVIHVRILSADIGNYNLEIKARSLIASQYLGRDLEDKYISIVNIRYPPNFPGMELWAAVLLVLVSATVYSRRIL